MSPVAQAASDRTFGAFLALLRQTQKLSREVLADRAGISYSHLANLERGARRPSPGLLTSLEVALGLNDGRLARALEAASGGDETGMHSSASHGTEPQAGSDHWSTFYGLVEATLHDLDLTPVRSTGGTSTGPDFRVNTPDGRTIHMEMKRDTTRRGKVPRRHDSPWVDGDSWLLVTPSGVVDDRRAMALRGLAGLLPRMSVEQIELLSVYARGVRDASGLPGPGGSG